jgi:hypothetical protein
MSAKFAFTPIPPARTADSRRPAAIDALAGTWRGRFTDDEGNVDGFTLLRDGSVDASVVGRFLFFASLGVPPTGMKLLEANERVFVALIGPYFDPRENADVVTVLEGARNGPGIDGTFYTRLHSRHEMVRTGRFTASRADLTHQAA